MSEPFVPTSQQVDTEFAVEVQDLVKTFPAPGGGTFEAVDGISFAVSRGEVFGLLGPNGAGKTTTFEIIEGLQAPTSGHSLVVGLDCQRDQKQIKELIGVQLQSGTYFDYLTLEEILDLFGSFYPKRLQPLELLEKVGLVEKRMSFIPDLSGGQAQRFSLVAAMVNDPEVLFLDEPTTGLDPQARRGVWDLVTQLNNEGKTIILTTHYMEEAELLCDRVAIIDRGKIRAQDTPLGLVRQLQTAYRIAFVSTTPVEEEELKRLPGVAEVHTQIKTQFGYELTVHRSQETLPAFVDWARSRGLELDDVRVTAASLEDVFLDVTGRSLRE